MKSETLYKFYKNKLKVIEKSKNVEIIFTMNPEILREKIKNKLKEKGWSISYVEKKFNLSNGLRYFVSGRTKNPKLESLVSFSKVLEIDLTELMANPHQLFEKLPNTSINKKLFHQISSIFLDFLIKQTGEYSTIKVFTALQEFYSFCHEKQMVSVDENLAELFFIKTFKE